MNIAKQPPGPGEESVWDYPRPPRCESFHGAIRIMVGDTLVASTTECFRVLETSHPPVYYIAPEHIQMSLLERAPASSWCEWKGQATYHSLILPDRRIDKVAWSYENPSEAFTDIRGHLAFYPSRVDACYVNDERVAAQPGDFYGGWITSNIVGPFKGSPGTMGW